MKYELILWSGMRPEGLWARLNLGEGKFQSVVGSRALWLHSRTVAPWFSISTGSRVDCDVARRLYRLKQLVSC